MTRSFQALSVGFASVSIIALAGCGPGGLAGDEPSESPPSPQAKPTLSSLDPCSLLKPEEAKEFGFEVPGEKSDILPSEPGCEYSGEPFSATLSYSTEKSVDRFGQQDNWATFDRTKVNGRTAATAIDGGATQARICTTLFDAGEGSILIDLSEKRDKGLDECAESKKIAEAIEPRMPK